MSVSYRVRVETATRFACVPDAHHARVRGHSLIAPRRPSKRPRGAGGTDARVHVLHGMGDRREWVIDRRFRGEGWSIADSVHSGNQ